MAVQALFTPQRVFNEIAGLEAGAKAYFYQSGTTTLETVYSDEALSVAHASPLVANSEGVFEAVFHSGSPALRCVITDADGNTRYTVDPVSLVPSGTAASAVSFTPITNNAATNVQTAIANNTSLTVANKQLLENAVKLPTLAGGTTAYTLASANTIDAYAAGQAFQFVVNATNTGAVTLNVDSLGAKNVKRYNNSTSLTDLIADDWRVGEVHEVVYDGTQFVVTSSLGAKVGGIRGLVEKATTAEAEAGTEHEKYPDVVKVAEAILAQQWVQARAMVDGTAGTPTASASRNINSVTDNGTGDYTLAFNNAFTNANYQVSVSIHGTGGVGGRTFVNITPAAGNCRIYLTDVNGTAVDRDFTFVAFGAIA